MPTAYLSHNAERIVISPDEAAAKVLATPRAQFMMKALSTQAQDLPNITIRCGEDGLVDQLKLIERLMNKLGVHVVFDEQAGGALEEYAKEQEEFSKFADKAGAIWSNEIVPEELSDFTSYLKDVWPVRHLYRLQLLAAFHLAYSRNACNFSVPGAGKTSSVYAAYGYLRDKSAARSINKLVVVGPLSSFVAWEDEYQECFGVAPYSVRLSGAQSANERRTELLSGARAHELPEVMLTSYQTFSNHVDDFISFLARPDINAMLVLDEAHRAKNTEGGVWAEAVIKAAPYAASRVILTGTPAPNGYEDLYNLFTIIWPSHQIIPFKVGQLRDMSERPGDVRVEKLLKAIQPFYVRIRKSDLNLPDPIEHPPTILKMGPIQERIYRYLEDRSLRHLLGNSYGGSLHKHLSKAAIIRLMQAATYPKLLLAPIESAIENGGEEIEIDDPEIVNAISSYDQNEQAPKIAHAIALAADLVKSGEKVIIWCCHIGTMKWVHKCLGDEGFDNRLLYGGDTIDELESSQELESRDEVIRRFHHDDCQYKILIANAMAVGESISLHRACAHAIYLERNFNAGLFLQSKDRIHRVGMLPNRTAHYHYLMSENSVDRAVEIRLRAKVARMMAIIESSEIPLLSMNQENDNIVNDDIRAILAEYESGTSRFSS